MFQRILPFCTLLSSVVSDSVDAHVLDISIGQGADGVLVSLYQKKQDPDPPEAGIVEKEYTERLLAQDQGDCAGSSWIAVGEQKTQKTGRTDVLTDKAEPGEYKLRFHTEDYFKARSVETFFPYVEVHFRIKDGEEKDQNYHVPITLSPFGYSTYKGQ